MPGADEINLVAIAYKDEVAKAKQLKISNGAAIITQVGSGDILAMVGSKDYWAKDIDGKYNVTTALRQPGSSIKPINYLLALQKGKRPWIFCFNPECPSRIERQAEREREAQEKQQNENKEENTIEPMEFPEETKE
jgi:membrane peptidoglycan carboxypeptidase